jgi:hypothetical protein
MTALQWWASNPHPYDYETDAVTTVPSQLDNGPKFYWQIKQEMIISYM